jgi:oxygen-independent coproporphyrinogen III oxidase
MDLYSLYLHIPFCRHRCSYCDFNTFAGQDRLIPAYVEALCAEIRQVSASAPERLAAHTIFFGGGTPSLLAVEHFQHILAALADSFDLQPGSEVTIEANPGTVTQEYLAGLRGLGINRLSFGMQSAHPDDLRLLERIHDFYDVVQAVGWARQAGFENVSLDLIFGLPGQSLQRWTDTLERALGMSPDHLSLYALTIEHGTPLRRRWERGLIPLVDDDLSAEMYELAMERLEHAGYVQYEISNWATRRPDGSMASCLHNLQYWRSLPYLGLGAGAHGYAAHTRTMNVGGIRPYIERCRSGEVKDFPASTATRRTIPLDLHSEMQEMMMVGLRLTQDGVADGDFHSRFGQAITEVFGKEIPRLEKAGLLEWVGDSQPRLRLTQRGRLLGNQVFMQFVG